MTRAERRHRRWRKVAYGAKVLFKLKIPTKYATWWADNLAKCDCGMCNGSGRHRKPEPRRANNRQTYWEELSDA